MSTSSAAELDALVEGIRKRDRATLGRAITLVESSSEKHQARARALIERLLPETGGAVRVGISGVPGAGKSSFIETLGGRLTAAGHRVAVLAVDPSSGVSGGSILGDKTRMERLAADPSAFIRPSPNSGTLGGVARKTRETMLICEAAGYDIVLVETVGVGQSETEVAAMVDVFCALLLAGAGDELQGIKRGLLELVDVIAVNKADGAGVDRATRAVAEIRNALHILRGGDEVAVQACSALEDQGIDTVWDAIQATHTARKSTGELDRRRREQEVSWMWSLVREAVDLRLRGSRESGELVARLESDVRRGERGAMDAAAAIQDLLFGSD